MQIYEKVMTDIQDAAGTIGAELRFIVPIVGRSKIFAILVSQTAGTLSGFSVELYSKYAACPANYPTTDPAPPAAEVVPALYLVTPALTAAALANIAVVRDSNGIAFVNNACGVDGRLDESYMRLIITSPAAAKKFDVRIVYAEQDS